MSAPQNTTKIKTASQSKPLAWWKKILIAVFGTYIAAKLFGILVPDISTTGILQYTDSSRHTEEVPPQTDEYPDDTWDYPADDRYEDEDIYADDLPPAEDLYADWNDWNEGYDDDHFS